MGSIAVAFVAGLLSSFVASVIFYALTYTRNWITAKYPRFLGPWRGTFRIGDECRQEMIRVTQQFRRRFRGEFLDSATAGKRSYRFSGHFITPDLVLVTFEPANSSFADYGAAILKVHPQRESAAGAAISIDLETGEPTQMKYEMERP